MPNSEDDLRGDIPSRAHQNLRSFMRGDFSLRAKCHFKGGLKTLDETMVRFSHTSHTKKSKIKKSRHRPDLAQPQPTNLPETKILHFSKKSSPGDYVWNFCTDISLRNRGKIFPYKKCYISKRDRTTDRTQKDTAVYKRLLALKIS